MFARGRALRFVVAGRPQGIESRAETHQGRLRVGRRQVQQSVALAGLVLVYGGFVVQKYALQRPDRVAGLALYDTSPVTGPEFWASATAGLAEHPARYPDAPGAAEVPAAFQRAATATNDDDLSAALREALPVYFADFWSRRAEFKDFQAGVRAWPVPGDSTPFDVHPHLAETTIPTSVIVGAHDFICGPKWAAMLHDGIPGSRLTTLPTAATSATSRSPAPSWRR